MCGFFNFLDSALIIFYSPSNPDCWIVIKRLNSCLAADVSCCYSTLPVPWRGKVKTGVEVDAEILLKMIFVYALGGTKINK